MLENEIIRKWFESDTILPEHSNLEIRQVSAWIMDSDNQVVIVSKDNLSWTIPGGHPEVKETTKESLDREVFEETGIDISNHERKLLGYYTISKPDSEQTEAYLQVSFFILINTLNALLFKPVENDDVKFVKLVNVSSIPEYVAWAKNNLEYACVMKLTNLQI